MQWIASHFRPLIITLVLLLQSEVVSAATPGEVQTITVMAEGDLAVPLALISSQFTHGRPISVSNSFGASDVQKKKIEDGESADLFITSQADLVQQLQTKGMIDVYSISPVATRSGKTYTVAVVAGENMTPARVFLDYLKSEEALRLLAKAGFKAP